MDTTAHYLRLILVARLDAGYASAPWRLKETLERAGHTVFLFTPRRWPGLFGPDGRLRLQELRRFVEVQRPDCLLVAEGLGVEEPQGAFPPLARGMLCATQAEAQESAAACEPGSLDFALAVLGERLRTEELAGFGGLVACCPPLPDEAYLSCTLANDVAVPPNVMCLQDATPGRVAFMQALRQDPRMAGVEVCCLGLGWPAEMTRDAGLGGVTYVARSSCACVVFEGAEEAGSEGAKGPSAPADALCTDALLSLVAADGARPVCVGTPASSWREGVATVCADADEALEELARRAEALGDDAAPAARRGTPGQGGPVLDDALADALERVRAHLAPRGLMAGSAHPRTVLCVLGYFGMGNFGDEYILATIARRAREGMGDATVVAVGENPEHTLRARGIYSVTLVDKHVLDEVLARSSAALVAAGLLFDQGVRWTMGKAELVSCMPHTDIPGIAAYVELASLNDTPAVFYCAGAGPLDVEAGRRLVRLMGQLGTRFLTRDEATTRLLRSCGVEPTQVQTRADAAFLAEAPATPLVDAWLGREGLDLARTQLVAVSLRAYENAPADFAGRVARALDSVAARHGNVEFAACVLDPSDLETALAVQAKMAASARLHVFDAGEDVDPVADLLARSSAGLSMRYHCSLVLAAHGHPCVGLGYLPKVAALYEDLGSADTLLPMDASAEDMARCLETVLGAGAERLEALRGRVDALRAQALLAERELAQLVAGAAPAKAGAQARELFLRDVPASRLELGWLREELGGAQARAQCLEQELADARAERDEARESMRRLESSRSYRLGRALLTLPRALVVALRRMRGRG